MHCKCKTSLRLCCAFSAICCLDFSYPRGDAPGYRVGGLTALFAPKFAKDPIKNCLSLDCDCSLKGECVPFFSLILFFLNNNPYFCKVQSPMLFQGQQWEVGRHILRKDVYLRFCLWLYKNFATSFNSAKQKQRWMSSGYVYIYGMPFRKEKVCCNCYIISAWASALLVQTELGNAKAFVERDE